MNEQFERNNKEYILRKGYEDERNSSTVILATGATFTGQWQNCLQYSEISCLVSTDEPGTIIVDYSTDAVNIDRSESLNIVSPGDILKSSVAAKYFRIRYTNGLAVASYFRLQTILHLVKGQINADPKLLATMIKSGRVENLPPCDDRFTAINNVTNIDDVGTVLRDINHTANANWRMPATATTLSFVSTSAQDALGGTGIGAILIDGLDENYELATEVFFLTGGTPAVTTSTWYAVNGCIGIVAGTGLSAAGTIVCTSVNDASEWNAWAVGYITAQTGRYTVPAGYKFLFTQFSFIAGEGGDFNMRFFNEAFGSIPISLGDIYAYQNAFSISGNNFFIDEKSTIKPQAQRNSGSPSSRRLQTSFIGILGLNEDWDEYCHYSN